MDLARFLALKARNAGCLLSRETSTWLGMLHVPAFTTTEHSPVHARWIQAPFTEVPRSVEWQNRETKRLPTWAQRWLNSTTSDTNFRPTPLHYHAKVEAKLKQLEDQDIIEQVTGPTRWVSPLVKPNGDMQWYINMWKPNGALRRTHHPYPTSQQVLFQNWT